MIKVNKKFRTQANKIARKYNGYMRPEQFVQIYAELADALGVCVPAWSASEGTAHMFEIHEEEVENSRFVVLECKIQTDTGNNEYTVYFS